MKENSFDVIVIGSGMSGGWAAKEFTEKGMKTLVLERGRMVEHIKDYPTTNMAPWEFPFRKQLSKETKEEYPIQKNVYAFNESTKDFWASDKKHPYTYPEDKPFRWLKGFQTGGKSLLWYRQSYRLSEVDFEAHKQDGHGIDWPLNYKDIEPWYEYVEDYIGISGKNEGLRQLPDSKFLPPMQMNCVEEDLRDSIKENFDGRVMTIGRTAHLTVRHNERGPCQYRNMCETGCPFSGYFSSVSVTLPAAKATGNMTFKPNSVVHSIIYDAERGIASGVKVIDAETKEITEYYARVVFLCASTLPSTQIMLNSKSEHFPNGIANSSGMLGHHLMDHFMVGFSARVEGFEDGYYDGHRPNGIYIPRYQNLDRKEEEFARGFGFQGGASRQGWSRGKNQKGFGADFKESLSKPGPWYIHLGGYGECLPYFDNMVELHPELKDEWGMPILHISCELKENEHKIMKTMVKHGKEMLEQAGYKDVNNEPTDTYVFGEGIHEMGTARMGKDPKTSVLNEWNACHDVPNLFVTDGSFMTSAGCQNPSLTYMAFTARAANYAVEQMEKGIL
ncbi:GMC oxidoreductase [Lutimonas sp.]|uniref:GMC oxidoreductase n=1 Tax=Lutimonas sp. TaxID=1872403 RepID=UPI003D9B9470